MQSRQDDNAVHAYPPMSEPDDAKPAVEYAGFWIRFLASVLDTVLLIMVMVPLLLIFYGPGVLVATQSPGLLYDLINYGLPVVAVVIFWQYRSATPGKMMMGIYIVDAKTLQHPPFGRLVLRYFGYYLSIFTLFLGFIWIAFDRHKQGFHDKIASTVVIKKPPAGSADSTDSTDATENSEMPVTHTRDRGSQKQDPWKE